MECLSNCDALAIHFAIHSGDTGVGISNGSTVRITKGKNGCSDAYFGPYRFMEQNRTKNSKYAQMARRGQRITWVMVSGHRIWGRIVDDRIEKQPAVPFTDKKAKRKKVENKPDVGPKGAKPNKRSKADLFDSKPNETLEDKKKKILSRTFTIDIEFPAYWCTPLNKILRIKLESGDREYKHVDKVLNASIHEKHKARYGYSSFKIHRLYRLQHPELYAHFFLRKREIKRDNADRPAAIEGIESECLIDRAANEMYLFHGLNPKIVDVIAENGFDERVANLAGMFGCGVYFAENSSKSAIYSHATSCAQIGAQYRGQTSKCTCKSTTEGLRMMFLCRVAMGTPWVRLAATDSTKPLRRPPEKEDGGVFDSVLGQSKYWDSNAALDFREFIVYDRRQCYPEYLIEFRIVK